VIRTPSVVIYVRNPNITVGALINPTTIGGKLGFILVDLSGEIGFFHCSEVKVVSRVRPFEKIVAVTGIEIFRTRKKGTIGCHQPFF
jgi:hypothetical protein